MRPYLLILFLLTYYVGTSQTGSLPAWFSDIFKSKGLDKKYLITSNWKPFFLQADFNGDAVQDIAVWIIEKTTKRKGILLIHGKTNELFVFGAGTSLGDGGNDFTWVDKWTLYTQKTAFKTRFDKKTGDITGGKEVKLNSPGILIEEYEDGAALAGGIIYWNGKKYVWIHQGE